MRDEAVPTSPMDWDPDRPAPGHFRPYYAVPHRVPTLCDNDELSMCSVAPNISPRPPDPKTQPGGGGKYQHGQVLLLLLMPAVDGAANAAAATAAILHSMTVYF